MNCAEYDKALVAEVKTSLRITTDTFDDNEIIPLIEAALSDMESVGIKTESTNPLHRQAVKCYVKGYFGENPNRIDWREAYESLRDAISLRSDSIE